jgi:uncharacterized delta-60 repeat protein
MKGKFLGRTVLPLVAAGLLVVACNSTTTNNPGPASAFLTLRLNANGTADTTFGPGGTGFVTTGIGTSVFDFALTAAVQPADNKIVAAGSHGLAGQGVIALIRYSQSGVADAGFGTGGIVTTPTPPGWTSASATAIAVQPADGKIVVAAVLFNGTTGVTGIAVLRYGTDGTLDASFGTAGLAPIQSIGKGIAGDTCAMALQGTNIVVAGASSDGNLVLYRFDATGALDGTFGTSGKTTTSIGAQGSSPGLGFQSSGNIIVVSGNGADHVMARYSASGALDTTFNPTGTQPGVVVTDAGGVDFANAVAVQSDDKIVVAGHANVNFTLDTSDISLIRYNADGTLDSTFVGPAGNPTPGIVTTDLGGFDNAFSVALQSPAAANTAIWVAGNTGTGGFSRTAVLRYNTDGTLDTSFGNGGGIVIVPVFGPSTVASGNVVIQTPLGVVVAGYD